MARELLTTWTDYRIGLDRLLALANEEILIWDPDLVNLQIDAPTRIDGLQRLLTACNRLCVRIAVQDAEPFRLHHPRLMSLLTTYQHALEVHLAAESLASLRDAMVLVDRRHGLIRFDRDHPRAKLLTAEVAEILPYCKRFEEIWAEGGSSVSPTTPGL